MNAPTIEDGAFTEAWPLTKSAALVALAGDEDDAKRQAALLASLGVRARVFRCPRAAERWTESQAALWAAEARWRDQSSA